MRNLLLITMFSLVASSATAVSPVTKVTGIYSDLHYIADAGDVLGMEILIVLGGEQGYFAVLQCAEGLPSKPVVVAATVRGAEVEFAPHDEPNSHCPKARFIGTVTRAGLRGKFEGTNYPVSRPHDRDTFPASSTPIFPPV